MRQCSADQQRLVHMLKESISLMCKSALAFEMELSVEGLLGITLDKRDVFLVNINECFKSVLHIASDHVGQDAASSSSSAALPSTTNQKHGQSETNDTKADAISKEHSGKKRRRRQSEEETDLSSKVPSTGASPSFLPDVSVDSEDSSSSVSGEQGNSADISKRLHHQPPPPPAAAGLPTSNQPRSPQASFTETSFEVSDSGGGLDSQILSQHGHSGHSGDIDLGNISVKREISMEADYAAHLGFPKNNSDLQSPYPTSVPIAVPGPSRHNAQVPSNLSAASAATTESSHESSHPGLTSKPSFPSVKQIMHSPPAVANRIESSGTNFPTSWPGALDLQQPPKMVPLYDARGNLLSMEAWKMREYRHRIKSEEPMKYAQTKVRNRLRQRELRRRMSDDKKVAVRVQDRDRMRQHRMVKKIHGMRTVVLQSKTNPPVITTTVTSVGHVSDASTKLTIAQPSHSHPGPFVTPTQGIGLPQAAPEGPLSFFNSPQLSLFDPHRNEIAASFDVAGHPLAQNCNKPQYFG